MAYELNPLGFPLSALAPYVSEATLRHHREAVHKSYIDALNGVLRDRPDLAAKSIEDLLRGLAEVPSDIRQQVSHLGGGHANHQFLWKVIGPQTHTEPVGDLATAIDASFGSFSEFQSAFEDAARSLGTEGWCFLSLDRPVTGDLEILALPGNGSVLPIAKPGILICDLWDHGTGGDPFPAFWNIVDWEVCETRLNALRAGKAQL